MAMEKCPILLRNATPHMWDPNKIFFAKHNVYAIIKLS